jgi:hypothetical protein
MGHVARFPAMPARDGPLARGQTVVVQSHRGVELGEVLVHLETTASPPADDPRQLLRLAGPDDLERARHAESLRDDRFAVCQGVLHEENWPWELIDVEPMLDDRSIVLHYLGPHHLDAAMLRARFRMTCDFDIVLEPVGLDLEDESGAVDEPAHAADGPGGCGRCGPGGGCGSCGSGGGKGTDRSSSAATTASRAPSSHAGCESCGISRLRAGRDRRPVAAAT